MIPSEPESGDCAIGMDHLDRVWRVAWLYGYRVGLQLAHESPLVVLHVRDMTQQHRVIAVIAPTIDDAAQGLLERMVADEYVPREIATHPRPGHGVG